MADYCTQTDMKDVYPHLDEFDGKTPIYNWVVYSGSVYVAHDSGKVIRLFENGKSLGTPESALVDVDATDEWFYDSTIDAVYFYSTADPNDKLMEAGEDFATLIARYITNASRYLDSSLNSVLPREQFKNADGTYDYVIIRLTSLLAVYFLIVSDDPANPQADPIKKEVDETIEALVDGRIKLEKDITADGSKGVLREVTHTTDKMLPVDTRGNYIGVYDKIKIKITTGGGIGTAQFTASVASDTGLKTTDLDPVTITGGYDILTGGLEIRFAADSTDTSTWDAAKNDEWELEVYGKYEEVDRPNPGYIRASRW